MKRNFLRKHTCLAVAALFVLLILLTGCGKTGTNTQEYDNIDGYIGKNRA